MKQILIVAESIDIEDSSGSKANVALIKNLAEAGFSIKVYHYSRKVIELPGIESIPIKENKWNSLYILSRLQRYIQNYLKLIINKPLENWSGFSFTFFNDSKSIEKALKEIVDFRPDIVLTLSKGTSFRPHHALLKLPELHKRWMAYIHDPYPFHYYPEPYFWSEPGYKKKIKFFEEVAKRCKWTGYPSSLLAEWMEDHYENFKNKRVIIPHQLTEKRDQSQIILPTWFDQSSFNILHAGNLMKQRDPFPLIEAFQNFLTKYPDAQTHARLLLVGSSPYNFLKLKKKEQEIEQLFISNGYVAYDVVLKLQEKTSVNVILESVAKQSPFLPGKFPHCVFANKPILYLGPEKSEVRKLLGIDYSYATEADDVNEISSLIALLYNKWENDKKSLILDRSDLREYLSLKALKKKINSL